MTKKTVKKTNVKKRTSVVKEAKEVNEIKEVKLTTEWVPEKEYTWMTIEEKLNEFKTLLWTNNIQGVVVEFVMWTLYKMFEDEITFQKEQEHTAEENFVSVSEEWIKKSIQKIKRMWYDGNLWVLNLFKELSELFWFEIK